MSLHDKIMNIPCKYTRSCFPDEAQLLAYKEGHRDARHEAAEMTLGIEEINAELVEALENLLAEWNCQMSSYEPLQIAIDAEKVLLKAYK